MFIVVDETYLSFRKDVGQDVVCCCRRRGLWQNPLVERLYIVQ